VRIMLCRWLQAAAAAGNTDPHSKQTSSYAVSYTMGWEPYIVINKKLWKGLTKHGMFDRRFRVKGWDKASFVYEVATRFVHCSSTTATLSAYLAEDFAAWRASYYVCYGVAVVSRIDKMIGLFCERDI